MERGIEREKMEAVKFDDFSLSDIPWREVGEYDGDEGEFRFREDEGLLFSVEVPVDYKGEKMILHGARLLSPKGRDEYSLNYKKGDDMVTLDYEIVERDTEIEAESCVEKMDPERNLPKGLGMELYTKVFDFLQEIADDRSKPVEHMVIRDPDISSERPISIERWNEIFIPILESEGYKKYAQDSWVKIYTPKK